MNTPLFPIATILLAAVEAADTTPTTLIGIAEKYGPLGLIALAMGGFAVWQEKQRRTTQEKADLAREERDRLDREERKQYHDSLMSVIAQKDQQLAEKDSWILGQVNTE